MIHTMPVVSGNRGVWALSNNQGFSSPSRPPSPANIDEQQPPFTPDPVTLLQSHNLPTLAEHPDQTSASHGILDYRDGRKHVDQLGDYAWETSRNSRKKSRTILKYLDGQGQLGNIQHKTTLPSGFDEGRCSSRSEMKTGTKYYTWKRKSGPWQLRPERDATDKVYRHSQWGIDDPYKSTKARNHSSTKDLDSKCEVQDSPRSYHIPRPDQHKLNRGHVITNVHRRTLGHQTSPRRSALPLLANTQGSLYDELSRSLGILKVSQDRSPLPQNVTSSMERPLKAERITYHPVSQTIIAVPQIEWWPAREKDHGSVQAYVEYLNQVKEQETNKTNKNKTLKSDSQLLESVVKCNHPRSSSTSTIRQSSLTEIKV